MTSQKGNIRLITIRVSWWQIQYIYILEETAGKSNEWFIDYRSRKLVQLKASTIPMGGGPPMMYIIKRINQPVAERTSLRQWLLMEPSIANDRKLSFTNKKKNKPSKTMIRHLVMRRCYDSVSAVSPCSELLMSLVSLLAHSFTLVFPIPHTTATLRGYLSHLFLPHTATTLWRLQTRNPRNMSVECPSTQWQTRIFPIIHSPWEERHPATSALVALERLWSLPISPTTANTH